MYITGCNTFYTVCRWTKAFISVLNQKLLIVVIHVEKSKQRGRINTWGGSKGSLVFLRGQSRQKCVFFPAASDFWVARAPSSSTILTDVYFQNIWSPHKVSEGLRTSFELHIRAWPAGGHSMCRQSKAFQLWKTHPLVYTYRLHRSVCVFLILRHDCNTEWFYKCQVSLCTTQKVLMSLDCLER